MEEQKRFQKQTLNSEDYEKTEEGAKAVRIGMYCLSALIVAIGIKHVPAFMKNLRNLRK